MRVLMLHGYTECGEQFRVKMRRLEQRIESEYPNSYFHYPSGPIKLSPQNRTEYFPGNDKDDEEEGQQQQRPATPTSPGGGKHFAWYDHHSVVRPHPGYQESFSVLAKILRDHGPFDGVVAFSQGTILAGKLISLLQGAPLEAAIDSATAAGVSHAPFPEQFRNLRHPSFKFAVLAGPMMATEDYYSLYYGPHINRTPICHVVGAYDPVVDLDVTERMLKTFVGPTGTPLILTHPGAHFVPTGEKYIGQIASFIRKSVNVSSDDIVRSLMKTSLCDSSSDTASVRSDSRPLYRQVKRRTAHGRKSVSFYVTAKSRSTSSSSPSPSRCPHRNCRHCGSISSSSSDSDSDARMPPTPPNNDFDAATTTYTPAEGAKSELDRSIKIMAETADEMEKSLDVTYAELSPTASLEMAVR